MPMCVPWHSTGDLRTAFTWFSPSTTRVPGIKLRQSGLVAVIPFICWAVSLAQDINILKSKENSSSENSLCWKVSEKKLSESLSEDSTWAWHDSIPCNPEPGRLGQEEGAYGLRASLGSSEKLLQNKTGLGGGAVGNTPAAQAQGPELRSLEPTKCQGDQHQIIWAVQIKFRLFFTFFFKPGREHGGEGVNMLKYIHACMHETQG